jgi:hypothetical protein
MTGLVFTTLSKFFEIGNIVNKFPAKDSESLRRESTEIESPSKSNKRMLKTQDKDEKKKRANDDRNIKHFSSVQNKKLYYPDIRFMRNRVMMNIEVPNFWHLDLKDKLTIEEKERIKKLENNVVYLKLCTKDDSSRSAQGLKPTAVSVFKIGELFSSYGDINVSL